MSRDDAPLVSVVIPHRDDLDNLRRCLDALGAQTWPSLEIVVADNNSAGGVAAVAAAAPHVLVVPAPEPGAGPARNCGADDGTPRASSARCFSRA
ncbi:MAG TPA: glycosyltransferase family A protein, partial [Stellaceae bacterium]|nr:glycosyltransferase family A protein [Stellaceae bacterium]